MKKVVLKMDKLFFAKILELDYLKLIEEISKVLHS
jgi:hypothetical protein